jgi:hypothetical protein
VAQSKPSNLLACSTFQPFGKSHKITLLFASHHSTHLNTYLHQDHCCDVEWLLYKVHIWWRLILFSLVSDDWIADWPTFFYIYSFNLIYIAFLDRLSKIYMITTNALFAALGLSFLIFGLLGVTNKFHGSVIIPDIIYKSELFFWVEGP